MTVTSESWLLTFKELKILLAKLMHESSSYITSIVIYVLLIKILIIYFLLSNLLSNFYSKKEFKAQLSTICDKILCHNKWWYYRINTYNRILSSALICYIFMNIFSIFFNACKISFFIFFLLRLFPLISTLLLC